MPLFQYQRLAEPFPELVLNPVAWLPQIAQPTFRIVRIASFSPAFAGVAFPVPETTMPWAPSYPVSLRLRPQAALSETLTFVPLVSGGVVDDKIWLGQKSTMTIGVNPSVGGGALYG